MKSLGRILRLHRLSLAGLLLFVSLLAIVIGKGEATPAAGIAGNIVPVARSLVVYAAGGIPAFAG